MTFAWPYDELVTIHRPPSLAGHNRLPAAEDVARVSCGNVLTLAPATGVCRSFLGHLTSDQDAAGKAEVDHLLDCPLGPRNLDLGRRGTAARRADEALTRK